MCPPEITELKKGQVSSFATLCIEFTSASNRDGDLVARLDVKSSTGGVPIDVKPSLGELLRPCKQLKAADFDTSMNQMQGFQRVVSSFTTALALPSYYQSLPSMIVEHAALTPVGSGKQLSSWTKDSKLRLVGRLPASDEFVYVLVECEKTTGAGNITVCCDHAVAGTSIMNLMKRAVATNPPE
jgi:hypothetical protein